VQGDAGSATRDSMPRYLHVAGLALVALGALNRASYVLSPSGTNSSMSGADAALSIVISALCVFGGLGLVFRRRWGWWIGILLGVLALFLGVLAFAAPDTWSPGEKPVAVILTVPGILLLVGLLSPRTLRWLRRRATPGLVS
jgi:peptidoglycan/LPS O-acetylase OafA/YrhL